MVPALVKLGMKSHAIEQIAYMFVGFSSKQEHNFHPCSAQGSNSDCYLKPVRIFPDPFRCDPHILVLCEVLDSDKNPAATNHRFSCNKTMTKGTGFIHPFYCVTLKVYGPPKLNALLTTNIRSAL